MKFLKTFFFSLTISLTFFACSKSETNNPIISENDLKELTIFYINDQHGQLDNFSKIKYIIDQEKTQTNVMVVCSGDIFSGNPIVDNYEEKDIQ
jgi:2',3'-cyclic-nucleotide 2'-phosphodiesterase (5'-nucleotidase family)